MSRNANQTSKETATVASELLRNKKTSEKVKQVAASALGNRKKRTIPKKK